MGVFPMLEKWLKTLEEKEKRLLQEVPNLISDTKTIDLAQREIKINAQSCRNYLEKLSKESPFPLTDKLREVQEIYDKSENEHYRALTNHINGHLWRMNKVIEQLREGCFEPVFAHNY